MAASCFLIDQIQIIGTRVIAMIILLDLFSDPGASQEAIVGAQGRVCALGL